MDRTPKGGVRACAPAPEVMPGDQAMLRFIQRHPVLLVGAVIIIGEGVFLSLAVPKAATAASEAEISEVNLPDGWTEISLGDFRVRTHQIPGDNYVLKFSLCITVPQELEADLDVLLKDHEQRVREAVAIVARRADALTLAEPSLPTLKRRMKAAIVSAIQTDRFEEIDVLLPAFLMTRG